MSDQDIVDTIEGAICAGCSCDSHCTLGTGAGDVLAALRSAGYDIVKLPEPDPPGEGWIEVLNISGPAAARVIAAALLAEADAAEG